MGVPVVAQWLMNPTKNHEFAVWSLALLSGLRIQCCRELWCRSQTRLGSRVAAAVVYAGGYSSNEIPSLGTFICHGWGPRKDKKKKKKRMSDGKLHLHYGHCLFPCSPSSNLSTLVFLIFHVSLSKGRLHVWNQLASYLPQVQLDMPFFICKKTSWRKY